MPTYRDFTQMTDDEFQEMIDSYTPPSEPSEMSLTFFKLLYESSKKRVKQTIPLNVSIKDGEIEFSLPQASPSEATIQIRNNEILVGDRRLVVTLANQGASEQLVTGDWSDFAGYLSSEVGPITKPSPICLPRQSA